MLKFKDPDSEQTLEQGLEEYYTSQQGLVGGRGPSETAIEFFRCHDAAHVVFGCSTQLRDEGVVKIWSFFGTTEGLSLIKGYRLPESKQIYEKLELGPILSTAIRALSFVPRVLMRCMRMRKRWPWNGFETHLQHSLREIRSEYGIQILP